MQQESPIYAYSNMQRTLPEIESELILRAAKRENQYMKAEFDGENGEYIITYDLGGPADNADWVQAQFQKYFALDSHTMRRVEHAELSAVFRADAAHMRKLREMSHLKAPRLAISADNISQPLKIILEGMVEAGEKAYYSHETEGPDAYVRDIRQRVREKMGLEDGYEVSLVPAPEYS